MRNLSLTFREAINAETSGEVLLVLIEIDHTDWAVPVRVAMNNEDVVSNGNTFYAANIGVSLPEDSEALAGTQLSVGNVDRRMVDEIRGTLTNPSVRLMAVLASDPDTVEIDFQGLELFNVSYDALAIRGEVSVRGFMTEPYPGDMMIPSMLPGLF